MLILAGAQDFFSPSELHRGQNQLFVAVATLLQLALLVLTWLLSLTNQAFIRLRCKICVIIIYWFDFFDFLGCLLTTTDCGIDCWFGSICVQFVWLDCFAGVNLNLVCLELLATWFDSQGLVTVQSRGLMVVMLLRRHDVSSRHFTRLLDCWLVIEVVTMAYKRSRFLLLIIWVDDNDWVLKGLYEFFLLVLDRWELLWLWISHVYSRVVITCATRDSNWLLALQTVLLFLLPYVDTSTVAFSHEPFLAFILRKLQDTPLCDTSLWINPSTALKGFHLFRLVRPTLIGDYTRLKSSVGCSCNLYLAIIVVKSMSLGTSLAWIVNFAIFL